MLCFIIIIAVSIVSCPSAYGVDAAFGVDDSRVVGAAADLDGARVRVLGLQGDHGQRAQRVVKRELVGLFQPLAVCAVAQLPVLGTAPLSENE